MEKCQLGNRSSGELRVFWERPQYFSSGRACGGIGRVSTTLVSGSSAFGSPCYLSVFGAGAFFTAISYTCHKYAVRGSNKMSRCQKVLIFGLVLWLLGIFVGIVGSKNIDRMLILPLSILSILLVVGFLGCRILGLYRQGIKSKR